MFSDESPGKVLLSHWQQKLKENQAKRRQTLQTILERSNGGPVRKGSQVSLFFVNGGMLYLWRNWACSTVANSIDARKLTLVIGDEAANAAAEALGFTAVPAQVFDSETLFSMHVRHGHTFVVDPSQSKSASAAFQFGAWPHAGWNAMSIIALSDFVAMGYDTLLSDADTVWRKDPRAWLATPRRWAPCSVSAALIEQQITANYRKAIASHPPHRRRLRAHQDTDAAGGDPWLNRILLKRLPDLDALRHRPWLQCIVPEVNRSEFGGSVQEPAVDLSDGPDVTMMDDWRWDSVGPLNSGFIYVRSNCRTQYLAKILAGGVHVQIQGGSDQAFWNRLLDSDSLKGLSYGILPEHLFLNGPLVASDKLRWFYDMTKPSLEEVAAKGWVVAHSSWTASHKVKLQKLGVIGGWHLVGDPLNTSALACPSKEMAASAIAERTALSRKWKNEGRVLGVLQQQRNRKGKWRGKGKGKGKGRGKGAAGRGKRRGGRRSQDINDDIGVGHTPQVAWSTVKTR